MPVVLFCQLPPFMYTWLRVSCHWVCLVSFIDSYRVCFSVWSMLMTRLLAASSLPVGMLRIVCIAACSIPNESRIACYPSGIVHCYSVLGTWCFPLCLTAACISSVASVALVLIWLHVCTPAVKRFPSTYFLPPALAPCWDDLTGVLRWVPGPCSTAHPWPRPSVQGCQSLMA